MCLVKSAFGPIVDDRLQASHENSYTNGALTKQVLLHLISVTTQHHSNPIEDPATSKV